MDPVAVLIFLVVGGLPEVSSPFLREPAVAMLVELRFPLPRVLGLASSLSSDPMLTSLTPRAELPAIDAFPFNCGEVLIG